MKAYRGGSPGRPVDRKHDHSKCSLQRDTHLGQSSHFDDRDSLQVQQTTSHHLSYQSPTRENFRSCGVRKPALHQSDVFVDQSERFFADENKSPSMRDIRDSNLQAQGQPQPPGNHEDHYSSCSGDGLVSNNSQNSQNGGRKPHTSEKQKQFFETEFEMIENKIRSNVIRKREAHKSHSPHKKPSDSDSNPFPNI